MSGDSASKNKTTIPGPVVTDPAQGNLPDLVTSGSLHEFLRDMHRAHGPIVGFWLGPTFCVTIASPKLLKEQAKTFDRPKELFSLFEPLITPHSIQYANGDEGRKRHVAYSRCFSHTALQNRYHILQKNSTEVCTKWAELAPSTHIPLSDHTFSYAIKSILGIAFGSYFSDEKEVLKFKKAYDVTWGEMESRLGGNAPDEERDAAFEKYKSVLNTMLRDAVDHCKGEDIQSDTFVQVVQEVNQSQEIIDADMLTLCIGGFHTTALLINWCLYFLATHLEVQEKVYQEVTDLVGEEEIPFEAVAQLTYMRQVLDETLRCSILAPYAARVSEKDIVLDGYNVPAGTPVVHALGVLLEEETVFPDKDKFDPERFSEENRKKIPSLGFEPFGFAGKRKCPGFRLSYLESSILLGDLVRKFKIKKVEGGDVKSVFGLVTKPKEEIYVTVEKRQ